MVLIKRETSTLFRDTNAVQIIWLPSHKSQWYGIDTQSELVKTFIYPSFYIYINCAITRYSNLSLLLKPNISMSQRSNYGPVEFFICRWLFDFNLFNDHSLDWPSSENFISFCDPALVIPFKTLLKWEVKCENMWNQNVFILWYCLSNSALIF